MSSSNEIPEILVDTSVAVPLMLGNHEHHDAMVGALGSRQRRGLAGHAAFETYAVITRLGPPSRLSPDAAMRAISHNFPYTRYLGADASARLQASLPGLGIAGGAVFDALVAASAMEHDITLATRDERALRTYRALDVRVELIA